MFWKDWAGYHAVRSFGTCHEREYYAIRHAAGLFDVSPLFKYDVRGKDAKALLTRVMTRDISKLRPGRVTYCCWCDDAGKVMDDGTVSNLGDGHYRVTAAEPTFGWLHRNARGLDLEITDTTDEIGALAIQGPTARAILSEVVKDTPRPLEALKFFRLTKAAIAGQPVIVSRTGYTGDLGYEVWVARDQALPVWDAIVAAGSRHGLVAAGLDALDVTRVEAGFIMNGVDYNSANHCLIESRKSSPYELGLGWTVDLDRAPFNGQAALRNELAQGSAWATVGVELDWDEYEAHFAELGLPPNVCSSAWRESIPIYHARRGGRDPGRQIGYATSGAWSPILKKNLALATIEPRYQAPGTRVRIEITVEHQRRTVAATVRETPFFNPPRKRA